MIRRIGLTALLAAGPGCRPAPEWPTPQGAPEQHSAPTVRFVDRTEASGLGAFRQVNGGAEKRLIVETFGAGVALFDADGDGDLDVYFTNACRSALANENGGPADALFENDGAGRFRDVTAARGLGDTGWTTGVEVADVDGDGRLDLFLTGFRRQVLLVQRADGSFEDRTEAANLTSDRWSTGACFLDVDRDGDLDLFVVQHIDLDVADASGRRAEWRGEVVSYGPHGLTPEPDRFYLNRGDGTFADMSAEFGVAGRPAFGFEAVAFDADGDGWTDVYVANDIGPNHLWRNVGGRRFEEVGLRSGAALSGLGAAQAGMGVAVGDADGDGLCDLFVTNFSEDSYTLYAGRAGGRFDDVTARARLIAPTRAFLGWSTGFDDLDLDGDLDLWCVNGHVFPEADVVHTGKGYLQQNQVFINDGRGRFAEAFDSGGGFTLRAASRGAAAGDLDGDGDVDLVIANLDGPPTVLINETQPAGRPVVVRLRGRAPNTSAHGAVLTAEVSGRELTRVIGTGAGFLSSPPLEQHFGLGSSERIERLVVRWPSGAREDYPGVDAGFHVVLDETHGITERRPLGVAR